jgi:hypothetical protein
MIEGLAFDEFDADAVARLDLLRHRRDEAMVMAGRFRLVTGPCVAVTLLALSPKRSRL